MWCIDCNELIMKAYQKLRLIVIICNYYFLRLKYNIHLWSIIKYLNKHAVIAQPTHFNNIMSTWRKKHFKTELIRFIRIVVNYNIRFADRTMIRKCEQKKKNTFYCRIIICKYFCNNAYCYNLYVLRRNTL